eukprot:7483430-Prorocentrum_lima.AAC.1
MVTLSSPSTSNSVAISNKNCYGRFCVGQVGYSCTTATPLPKLFRYCTLPLHSDVSSSVKMASEMD